MTLSRARQRLRQQEPARTPEGQPRPGQPGEAGQPPPGADPRVRPRPDRLWWLALVAAGFTLVQVVFVVPRLGLSWDETVYVSQFSAHAPAAYFDPARARGIPLLTAPVTLLTASATALHLYLAVASGLGLFGALATWRRLRPAWMLALAGLVFAGLWTAEYYGPQAMPDLWVALSALAGTGFFLQAARRLGAGQRARGTLAGLAATLAAAALFRPGDALFLAGALILGVLAARPWRRWPLAVAVVAGLAAGGAEWVIEAFVRFGGVLERLHEAGAEQGGFGLYPGLWDELRALNGPTLCRPCDVGWRQPELGLWWLVLPVLVAAGIMAARRAGRLGSAVLPAACALSVAAQYLFLINYAAPRFLLPAYALTAIPVADALGWLILRRDRAADRAGAPAGVQPTGTRPAGVRPAAVAVLAGLLAVQLTAQHLVLRHEVSGTVTYHEDYHVIAADLASLGIRPPCLIKGEQFIPIAYIAGCASAAAPAASGRQGRVVVLEFPRAAPPGYARGWARHRLPGTRALKLVAYLPGRR